MQEAWCYLMVECSRVKSKTGTNKFHKRWSKFFLQCNKSEDFFVNKCFTRIIELSKQFGSCAFLN